MHHLWNEQINKRGKWWDIWRGKTERSDDFSYSDVVNNHEAQQKQLGCHQLFYKILLRGILLLVVIGIATFLMTTHNSTSSFFCLVAATTITSAAYSGNRPCCRQSSLMLIYTGSWLDLCCCWTYVVMQSLYQTQLPRISICWLIMRWSHLQFDVWPVVFLAWWSP